MKGKKERKREEESDLRWGVYCAPGFRESERREWESEGRERNRWNERSMRWEFFVYSPSSCVEGQHVA